MSRRRKISSASLGLICLALIETAHADPPAPEILPECKVHETKAGGEVCGFDNIEDVRAYYLGDAELVMRRAKAKDLEEKIVQLGGQVANLSLAVQAQIRATTIIRDRNAQLTEQLIDTDRKYQLERVKPRWGSPLAWTTAAVLGAALAGFIVQDVIN